MLSSKQKSEINNWMHMHYCYGDTATSLAEDAANHFELWDELDDPDSELWDVSARVMEELE